MSIQGNGGGGKVPPQTLGKTPPASTNAAAQSSRSDAPSKTAQTAQKENQGADTSRDGFDTSSTNGGKGLFAGGAHPVTGVRTSGVRQMGKVLEQTAQRVLVEIQDTRAEISSLTEELVASGFSDDGLSSTSPRRKDARRRLQALRKRQIALRRRLRLIGVEAGQTDPVPTRTLQSLQESLDAIDDKAPTAKKDRMLLLLQEGGANSGDVLRLPMVEGNRGADVAQSLLGQLPGQVTTAFLTQLLGAESPSSELELGQEDASVTEGGVVENLKLHAKIFAGAA